MDQHVYAPGYRMHFIHGRQLGETWWGWRDAVVDGYDRRTGRLTLTYLAEQPTVEVWHDRELAVTAGAPARVHEGLHAVDLGGTWINVRIESGGFTALRVPQTAITSVADGTGIAVNRPPQE
ncbi:hypothetical protein [Cumulibacter manganitolerans]|uniref:hypothetical protein n=1 Tax=Cumulibacter manganitolerans TaxID=1884992 RepID=UPI0012970D0C|nr:hypothetical protein [Cumulibacter manganitolerans]